MPDNYSQATVTPYIPTDLITDFEKLLLTEYGFQWEAHDVEPILYFYAEDNLSDCIYDFEVDQINEYATKGDEVAKDLLVKITQADLSLTNTDEVISRHYNWADIFQHILNKPGCEIDEIVVEGAFVCDRMTPGEFGGWVTRITKTSIQYRGTAMLLGQMREELAFLEAVDLVCDSSPETPNRDAAVKIIKEYCSNYCS